jgi:putative DNA methylase
VDEAERSERTERTRLKLIETAIPLDVVSASAAKEKSIRHGHPSTLHLWWSRKPLAAARAVLFAQLVDDPASRPDRFPTPELQDAERARLLDLVARLSSWDATADEAVMAEARREVAGALDGADVIVWDPFAGGGSIPLEAQRLGVPAVASDLNPVAVLLERAMLVLPRRWRGRPPVAAEATATADAARAAGLAADVREFGRRVLATAAPRLRPLYPTVHWDGAEHEVAAYLWVRTVPCDNPACGATVPMLSNAWLRRRGGREAWLRPRWDDARGLGFDVVEGATAQNRTARGAVFACVACGTPTAADSVKGVARSAGLGRALRCVVPDAGSRRPFLTLPEEQVSPPVPRDLDADALEGLDVDLDPRVTNAPTYGVATIGELHLPRQRAALAVLAAAVAGVTPEVAARARAAGWSGADADAYAADVTLLLGLVLGRLSNRMSTACIWNAHLGLVEQTFIQNNAIAFPWDFAEANPLSSASGSWASQLDWVARVVARCDPAADAVAVRHDARTPPAALAGRTVVVSTDPPYFDYFLYSALSDYFYVWLRRALRHVEPDLFATLGTPRRSEIVMSEGDGSGRADFLAGLTEAMTAIARTASPDFPVTIYYAYKSTESGAGVVSAWQAFLAAAKGAGLVVSATWPIRTERTEGIKTGTNSLGSSIVVACRRRPASAPAVDRRRFRSELRERIPAAVLRLQASGISPVDLGQAAIGPGMAVFTRYADVVDADGAVLGVGAALDEVNRVIAEALSEQEADLDPASRFCLSWYDEHGFEPGPYQRADSVAQLKNTSVRGLERRGVLRARAGSVQLLSPAALPAACVVREDVVPGVWDVVLHLAKRLGEEGVAAAGALLAEASERVDPQACRELAYLLYGTARRRGRSQDAALFNALGTSWNDLAATAGPAREGRTP